MESANTFKAHGTLDLHEPQPFRDVKTTFDAEVDLQAEDSLVEARSDDGDAWSEIVTAGLVRACKCRFTISGK